MIATAVRRARVSRAWLRFSGLIVGLAVGLTCLGAGSAWAYSLVISNGLYDDPVGVSAARHSLTKVDVTNTSPANQGYGQACEDAINSSGGWAQAYHYCAIPGGNYAYHLFCGCEFRYGWNGPYNPAYTYMVGIEYY